MGKNTLEQQLEELRNELKELRSKYDFLLMAVDHLPNPIFMKDGDGRFFFFNSSYADFFDMKQSDYIGKTALDLDYLPEESRKRFHKDAMALIENTELITYEANFISKTGADRPSFYWSCGFKDDSSGRHGLVGEIVDISKERRLQQSLDDSLEELRQSNEKLRAMAETDQASGLYNRTIMWSKGRELIEHGKKNGMSSCLLMIDLDHFKSINDRFGHIKGDDIIHSFADILRSECRSYDIPIRYGGDEFLVILYDLNLADAVNVAERIRSKSEKELLLPDGSSVTASIGVAQLDETKGFEDNLSRLDGYLYQAKTQGRNQIVTGL